MDKRIYIIFLTMVLFITFVDAESSSAGAPLVEEGFIAEHNLNSFVGENSSSQFCDLVDPCVSDLGINTGNYDSLESIKFQLSLMWGLLILVGILEVYLFISKKHRVKKK
jgi:hypothetical protein